MKKKRAAIVLTLAVLTLAAAPSADARTCFLRGREIRNLQGVTCQKAQSVAGTFWATFNAPSGWNCSGYKGSAWRGYCESASGKRYFTWRPLT